MALDREDREEIYGLSRAAAVQVWGDNVKEVFEVMRQDRRDAEKRSTKMMDILSSLQKEISGIPEVINSKVAACHAGHVAKSRWRFGFLFSTISAVGVLFGIFIKGCAV